MGPQGVRHDLAIEEHQQQNNEIYLTQQNTTPLKTVPLISP